ncbi:hypothetical protein M409DRAFT_21234 [Zasmidium cellare ATCC 36951]|uniref:Uncharacterized protein n=1 Tax=Zasmidium cellare ATCC 36951 TaxID=1080233 RepID=A0A6A6CMV7_ZASCE|nr:uncharacterized protein M409DRAFT_21234 [Zasmidium cellare ATCC 36951]KAF2168485.1 hypothetical protein M409DRAFT_21234 [Zasmidium cellare ATCC 36951]
MTVSWSADMDQRLLMAVLAVVKLDTAAVEEKWKELFKFEDITQPTKRAIVEHIAKLKKALGISGGKTPSGDAASTPTKPKAKGIGKAARKPKNGSKSPNSPRKEDRDDTEKPADIKDERMDSPM